MLLICYETCCIGQWQECLCWHAKLNKGMFIIIIIIITRHFYSALYNNTITLSALHV